MTDKLHIPGPDEREDFTELNIVLVISWAICMLICIGLFLLFRGRLPEPKPEVPEDPVEARQVKIIAQAEGPHRSFDDVDFGTEDAVAVFRHGPREAAEAACRKLHAPLASGGLSHKVHLELLKAVDRRAGHAPWTCFLRRFLAGEISEELD